MDRTPSRTIQEPDGRQVAIIEEICRTSRSEKPVSRVAQARQDIPFFVDWQIHHGAIDWI